MQDIWSKVETVEKYTAAPASPEVDRSEQSQLGMEIARRAAQRDEPPMPKPMVPIVPVAN